MPRQLTIGAPRRPVGDDDLVPVPVAARLLATTPARVRWLLAEGRLLGGRMRGSVQPGVRLGSVYDHRAADLADTWRTP